MPIFRWLFHSDAGLSFRILCGGVIFAALAIADFRRRRNAATKWREYSLLLAAVLVALAYGAINDQITVTISPEYFLYGKELAAVVGDPPRSQAALRWAAAKVGFKATWSVGLIFGVVLLLANNPWRGLPRLRNRRLLRLLLIIPLTAAVLGAIGGLLGYRGVMTNWQSDFQDIASANLWRPRRFMAAWGVHLGGYVGGSLGTTVAVVLLMLERCRHRRSGGDCGRTASAAEVNSCSS
jgi:hypothetical protein